MPTPVRVIDSHTEGEPTRLVIEGIPELAGQTIAEQAADFESNFNDFRTGLLLEPRGSDVWVGALLLPPSKPAASAGVIFFNNVGVLGMCGHGTIGLVASLAFLGKIKPGVHLVETPVGDVSASLNDDGSVSVRNVLSFRSKASVAIETTEFGPIVGDVAYGGNWFFLAKASPIPVQSKNLAQLTQCAEAVKSALAANGITGTGGAEIDHVELFGPAERADSDSKSFVLCPGNAYDRSPCGTGTSAKLACLAADGCLDPGKIWRQESVIGTVFEASYEREVGGIVPTITGRAYVTADSKLVFNPMDPFKSGILL